MQTRYWGIETRIDMRDCNKEIIKSADKLQEYAKKLVDVIKMKAYLNPITLHFGADKKVQGYTLVQFIETSLISGHFVDETGEGYINIFSCKNYRSDKAVKFTVDFFEAQYHLYKRVKRGVQLIERKF